MNLIHERLRKRQEKEKEFEFIVFSIVLVYYLFSSCQQPLPWFDLINSVNISRLEKLWLDSLGDKLQWMILLNFVILILPGYKNKGMRHRL